MLMLPNLIGAPVAFLPVPMPHTLFVAEGVPEPTPPAAPALVAMTATTSRASRETAASAPPSFLDLIEFLLGCCTFVVVGISVPTMRRVKPRATCSASVFNARSRPDISSRAACVGTNLGRSNSWQVWTFAQRTTVRGRPYWGSRRNVKQDGTAC